MNNTLQNNELYTQIAELLQAARQEVVRTINQTMVNTYYEIGRMIVEDEQQGSKRAVYGKQVLQELSKQLTTEFGKGFSVDNSQYMRQFYLTYSIYETTSRKFSLSWAHYIKLMRVANPDERRFYEIEATTNAWSLKELQCLLVSHPIQFLYSAIKKLQKCLAIKKLRYRFAINLLQ